MRSRCRTIWMTPACRSRTRRGVMHLKAVVPWRPCARRLGRALLDGTASPKGWPTSLGRLCQAPGLRRPAGTAYGGGGPHAIEAGGTNGGDRAKWRGGTSDHWHDGPDRLAYDFCRAMSDILRRHFWERPSRVKASGDRAETEGKHSGCWSSALRFREFAGMEEPTRPVRSNGTHLQAKDSAYQLWKFGSLGPTSLRAFRPNGTRSREARRDSGPRKEHPVWARALGRREGLPIRNASRVIKSRRPQSYPQKSCARVACSVFPKEAERYANFLRGVAIPEAARALGASATRTRLLREEENHTSCQEEGPASRRRP